MIYLYFSITDELAFIIIIEISALRDELLMGLLIKSTAIQFQNDNFSKPEMLVLEKQYTLDIFSIYWMDRSEIQQITR